MTTVRPKDNSLNVSHRLWSMYSVARTALCGLHLCMGAGGATVEGSWGLLLTTVK